MNQLSQLLSTYIATRDRLRRQHAAKGTGQMEFLREINGYAEQLGAALPGLTIAEMEALCELSASWLGEMRMRAAAFERK